MYIKEYKDKNGKKLFKFQAYLGTDQTTGERKRVTRTGLTSKKECEDLFIKLKYEFDNNLLESSKAKRYKFKEIFAMWDTEYKSTVRESTYNKTLGYFNNHILPAYEKMYIDMITPVYCHKVVTQWSKTNGSFKVMNNFATQIFQYASDLGLIEDIPTKKFKMPIVNDDDLEDKPTNFYTKAELNTFLNSVQSLNMPKWFTFFRVLAYSGMRKGEILALTWNDIYFTEDKSKNISDNSISVNKTLTRGLENKLIIQTTKTKSSRRIIPMDSATMNILKDWKLTQAKEMLKLGINTTGKNQLVFQGYDNSYINPQRVTNRINQITSKFNIKRISTHGFRHTHCSLLLEAGVKIKDVSKRLGHSDIKTTMNIYAHVSPDKELEAINIFAEYVGL